MRHSYPFARRYLDAGLNAQSHPVHEAIFQLTNRATGPDLERLLRRAGVRYMTSFADNMGGTRKLRYEVSDENPHYIHELEHARGYVSAFLRLGAC